MNHNRLWQTKLHARLHDPAEKALVLLRDPAGHEGGTVRALHRHLGFDQLPASGTLDPDNADVLDRVLFKNGIPVAMYEQVKQADHWAAAADRPQWPLKEITAQTRSGPRTFGVAPEAQVHWTKEPVLIHPLTGQKFDLQGLAETDIGDIKTTSFAHFSRLIVKDGDEVDWQRTLAAYWRFGPELAETPHDGTLGHLWPLLPADTRVPDHSIWDHLDLTSAFAGAFAGDAEGEAALLSVSLGPVQGFIAAARKTEDLWAGSHLLSRLAWEAIRVICEALGPDAVLFPRLRGVPQVDLWLRDELKLPAEWFKDCEWTRSNTDANPLFAAALPNRFVALVPASRARELAEAVRTRTQRWLLELGQTTVARLLEAAGIPASDDQPLHAQMQQQLKGFPEVHWAAVPFSLARGDAAKGTAPDTTGLQAAMAPFFGADAGEQAGFLASSAWQVLSKSVDWGDGTRFFTPNPGVLYPAVYDLAERALAASKSLRPFDARREEGYRDSLTGEVEWLRHHRDHLNLPPGQRSDTLWARLGKPAWAKPGEHLGALSAIKRLWPSLFAAEVARATGQEDSAASRFSVSTHTMAMAPMLEALDEKLKSPEALKAFEPLLKPNDRAPALPRSLAKLRNSPAARLIGTRDRLQDGDTAEDETDLRKLDKALKALIGHKPETYYALLLMDGDRMGRMLAGDPEWAITYRDSFHPRVRDGFDRKADQQPRLKQYGNEKRSLSPGRHFAISGALNDFALHVVPEVIEREHRGKLIYAGGDDVLAMLPVADVLSAARRLQHAYQGDDPDDSSTDWRTARQQPGMICKQGYAHVRGRLLRMMGATATVSAGIVIAHHQAPLSAVRSALAAAEQRAKNAGGRNAFSIALVKRSGGTTHFTGKWQVTLPLLTQMTEFLREPEVSRRAVYHSLEWLKDLPDDVTSDMLGSLLGHQLARQCRSKSTRDAHKLPGLVTGLAAQAIAQETPGAPPTRKPWLANLLISAEFLARQSHSPAATRNRS